MVVSAMTTIGRHRGSADMYLPVVQRFVDDFIDVALAAYGTFSMAC
jgi:hypothetical protein